MKKISGIETKDDMKSLTPKVHQIDPDGTVTASMENQWVFVTPMPGCNQVLVTLMLERFDPQDGIRGRHYMHQQMSARALMCLGAAVDGFWDTEIGRRMKAAVEDGGVE